MASIVNLKRIFKNRNLRSSETLESPDKSFRLEHANPNNVGIFKLYWDIGDAQKYNDFVAMKDFCTMLLVETKKKSKSLHIFLRGQNFNSSETFLTLITEIKKLDLKLYLQSGDESSVEEFIRFSTLIDGFEFSLSPDQLNLESITKTFKQLATVSSLFVNIRMSSENFSRAYALAGRLKEIEGVKVKLLKDGVFTSEIHQQVILRQAELFSPSKTSSKNVFPLNQLMTLVQTTGQQEHLSCEQLIFGNKNTWQNWQCSVGVEQLVIDASGHVFRGYCKVQGGLGHFSASDLKLPVLPVKCTLTSCNHVRDVATTKNKY